MSAATVQSIDADHVLNLCARTLYYETRELSGAPRHAIRLEPFAAGERAFSVEPARRALVHLDLTHTRRFGAASAFVACSVVPVLCYAAASARLSASLETHLITHVPSLVIVENEVEARALSPLLRERGHARAQVAWPPCEGSSVRTLTMLALQ